MILETGDVIWKVHTQNRFLFFGRQEMGLFQFGNANLFLVHLDLAVVAEIEVLVVDLLEFNQCDAWSGQFDKVSCYG